MNIYINTYNFQYHPDINMGCFVVKKEHVKDAHNNEVLRHNNKHKPQNGEGYLIYGIIMRILLDSLMKHVINFYKDVNNDYK